MTKPACPPLDLGEALTRNRITTWSGLILLLSSDLQVATCMLEVLFILGEGYT